MPDSPYFQDSFIVLNANRNQPRKRIDITLQGFARFAQGKPANVKLGSPNLPGSLRRLRCAVASFGEFSSP